MKDKESIIINIVILIFIIVLKFIFIDIYPEKVMVINALFWALFAIILFKLKGIWKNKTELTRSGISYIIIWILSYVLFSFLSGIYFGFLKNSYGVSLSSIMANIYSIVIMVLS